MIKSKYTYFPKTLLHVFFSVCLGTVLMGLSVLVIEQLQEAPEITKQTWPAGTFLSHVNRGARVATYHRGYVYLHSLDNTSVWDISNPASPLKVDEAPGGANGHRWWKMQDLFYREYEVPEVLGSGSRYIDLSNMLQRTPWAKSAPFPTDEKGQEYIQDLETFPHSFDGNNIWDMRSGELLGLADFSAGVSQELKVRIGNLLLFSGGGAAAYDIGDPENIQFLDALVGSYTQYTTTVHVWRHYLIFMNGDNSNEGANNLVAIDFSDPTDLKHAFGVKLEDSPGRYMFFQDEYGFTGRQHSGVKLNLETQEVEVRYDTPGHPLSFSDFQWIPLGHIIMASGAESGSGESFFYTHSDELDTNPPYVSFHNPAHEAVNQPLSSVIGLVINETLDDVTINDQTIQVSPLGGDPIAGDVVSMSYDVINFAPKEPLAPNTTYEVTLVEGGITDVAGNGIKEYSFTFTTGGGVGGATNIAPIITDLSYGSEEAVPVGTELTITASATDEDGDALTYRWDFNDGNPKTEWSNMPTIAKSFPEPGIYEMLVQVQDGKGGFASKSLSVIVYEPVNGPSPTLSGSMVLDDAQRQLWVANPDNNTVSIIDADQLTLVKEIPVGQDPTSVAMDAEGKVWVTCRDEDAVYVLDGSTGNGVKTISLGYGSRPYAIVFTPNGLTAYVSEFGSGKLSRIQASSMEVDGEIPLGPTPRALAISGDGEYLLATRFISHSEGGELWKVNLSSFQLSAIISLPLDKEEEDSGASSRGVPNYLAGVAIRPGNTEARVVGKKDNILRGGYRDGLPLTFEMTVRNAISSVSLTDNEEWFDQRKDIDNHAQPSSAIFSSLGAHLFLSMQGNNRVVVLDANTGLEITRHDVGLAPQGMLIDEATGRLFVKNFMDRSISVLDAQELLTTGTGEMAEVTTLATVTQEILSPQIFEGKQLFYNAADTRMGMDGYISCATCHIDGTQDGQTFDFTDRNEGLRNTITLKGRAGMGHGRVHWTANFDEIQDFENDIRLHFNGTGFLADAEFKDAGVKNPLGAAKEGLSEELDAMAAYIESLDDFDPSPYRNSDGSLTADGEVGKALFVELGCGACHSGTDFTDSDQGYLHDVGTWIDHSGLRIGKTLLGFDAPTLRGIWNTPPYLHDGSAATLKEVFTARNKGDHHGATSTLGDTELSQLVSYLNQIDGNEPAVSEHTHLAIISPLDGAAYPLQQEVPLGIETTLTGISKVVYYANGQIVAEATTAPYHVLWQPLEWGTYTIQAKVFHQQGRSSTLSRESSFTYKRPFQAIMVIGGETVSEGESEIAAHLTQEMGLSISYIRDSEVEQKLVDSIKKVADVLLVSSSIDPELIGEDLTHIPVPVVTWDLFSYRFFRLTGASFNESFGFTENPQSSIQIVNSGHPMAAALTDSTRLYQLIQRLPFGTPSSTDAVVIAESQGIPVIFGNEKGDASFSLARKVAFPLREDFLHLMTPEGWALFDAAVKWAIYGGDAEAGFQPLIDVRITSPQSQANVPASFNIQFETDNFTLGPMGSGQGMVYMDVDGESKGTFFSTDAIPVENLTEGKHTITLQLANGDWIRRPEQHTIEVQVSSAVSGLPTVNIVSPAKNATVTLPFELTYATENWNLSSGGRYAQLIVDGIKREDLFTTDPIQMDQLTAGFHTLEIQLIEADGSLANVKTSVTLFVENAAGNTQPVAVLKASTLEGPAPLLVNFDAAESADPDGDALGYQWNFDDGTTGEGTSVSHTFTNPGTYTVSLTVTDGRGGSNVALTQITVTEDITTSITPESSPIFEVYAYPNPTTGKAVVEVNDVKARNIMIEVLSVQGKIMSQRKVQSFPAASQKEAFDLSAYPTGIYFFRIRGIDPGDELTQVIRILKQ